MNKFLTIKNVEEMKFSKRMGIKVFALYSLVLCLGIFSVLVFLKGYENQKEYNFTYFQNNQVDYKVYLKENDFFEEEYLSSGTKYIASLIDEIAVDFQYDFLSNDKIDGDYEYYITARLEAKEKGKEVVIWSKEEVILDQLKGSIYDDNRFDLSASVNINYNRYNTIMNEFRNAYGVSVDGSVVITLNVISNLNHDMSTEPIQITDEANINIPLIEQMVDIEIEKYGEGENSDIIHYTYNGIWQYVLMGCGVLLFGYFLYLSLCTIKLLLDIHAKQNKYVKKLNYIFNNYDSIIVNVHKAPDTKGKTIIDVLEFNELLDAQANVNEPILYHNIENNKKCAFSIYHHDQVFRYKMSYTDFLIKEGTKDGK